MAASTLNDPMHGSVVGVRLEAMPQVVFVVVEGLTPPVGDWVTVSVGTSCVPGRVVIAAVDVPTAISSEYSAVAGAPEPVLAGDAGFRGAFGSIGRPVAKTGDRDLDQIPGGPMPGDSILLTEGMATIIHVDRRGDRIEFRMDHDGSTVVQELSAYVGDRPELSESS